MGTPYDVFTNAFLSKVREYDFIPLDQHDRNSIIDGYMKLACAKFDRICQYDLLSRDDNIREFTEEIPAEDLDDIADIVSQGMLVQWMQPYMYRSENLENILNTADFESYSPAELLYRITEAYKMARRDFANMMKDYSYWHGDLSDLHL